MAEVSTLHISRSGNDTLHEKEENETFEEEEVVVNVSFAGEPKFVTLKDQSFIEAAGLQKSGTSGRKSSVGSMLEESLNTAEPVEESSSTTIHNNSYRTSDSDDDSLLIRKRAQSTEKPYNLKSDQFIQDAGLSRTGEVPRKSPRERLLEEQLQISPVKQTKTYEESNDDRFIDRTKNTREDRSSASCFDDNDEGTPINTGRKGSIYEQKQIQAPTVTKGGRISNQMDTLFKQYKKDMNNCNASLQNTAKSRATLSDRKANYSAVTNEGQEKTKIQIAREQKEKELEEIALIYQQRQVEEENEHEKERENVRQTEEIKCRKSLGDIKSLYLSVAKGENVTHSDSENEDEPANPTHVDKNGSNIAHGRGKIKIVKSEDSVTSIRIRFGSISKARWQERNKDIDTDQVDTGSVNSARNVFKKFEMKQDSNVTFNRPTSRKVRDPKQLMEMRKKITYGGESDELPQDSVIKKSVVLDENELGVSSTKKDALNVYKGLQNKVENHSLVEKPKVRLLSENEMRAAMEIKQVDSLASETSDANETNYEPNGDVSGYGSGTPCSPTSTVSDGYSSLSDTKEFASVENEVNGDVSLDINANGTSLQIGKPVAVTLQTDGEDCYDNVVLGENSVEYV